MFTRIQRVLQKGSRRFEAHLLQGRRRAGHVGAVEGHVRARVRHVVGHQRQVPVVHGDPIGAKNHLDLLQCKCVMLVSSIHT